jgi:hypothetical protein
MNSNGNPNRNWKVNNYGYVNSYRKAIPPSLSHLTSSYCYRMASSRDVSCMGG